MAQAKRKRSASVLSDGPGGRLPSDSINPLSHSPGTLRQLAVAGLGDHEDLPARLVPGFPHRGLPRPGARRRAAGAQAAGGGDGDGDEGGACGGETSGGAASSADDGDDGAAQRRRRDRAAERKRDAQDAQLGFLTGAVLRCLEEGDVPRARRAFGLLRRSDVQGRPADLRRNGLWALGAEILMRDGEERPAPPAAAAAGPRPPWGAQAGIDKVKLYFEGLIRQYPYNRLFPRSVSAADFWPALLGCEFYHIHTQHRLALARLEAEAEAWEDAGEEPEEPPGPGGAEEEGEEGDGWYKPPGREWRLRQERDGIRLEMLSGMRDIAKRMNDLMENQPYASSLEMLRLRGMVALYMSDLVLPPAPRTAEEDLEGRRSREHERDRARQMFRRIVSNGGTLDRWIQEIIDPEGAMEEEEEGEEESETPMFFSSLPIRGLPS